MAQPDRFPFPRAFWWLLSGIFINRVGSCIYAFLTIYLKNQRHIALEEVGPMVALYGVGSLLAGPVGGFLADHWGRRITLLMATCAGAAAMIHVNFAYTKGHLSLAILLLGFCGDLYRPAAHAWVADLVPPEQRTRAYGWMYWASNIGFATAALLSGWLANINYNLLFWLDAFTTLSFGWLVFARVPEPTFPIRKTHRPVLLSLWESLQPYRRLAFVGFLFAQLWIELMYQQMVSALPTDMTSRGLSTKAFGGVGFLNGLLVVLLQPLLVRIVPHWSKRRALILGAVLIGGAWGSLGWGSHTLLQYILAVSILTIGEVIFACTIPSILVDMAPEHLRGSYQGAYQLMVSSALMLAPLYFTRVYARFGSTTLWRSFLALGLFTIVVHALLASFYTKTQVPKHIS